MRSVSPTLWLLLLLATCFTLATVIQPQAVNWNPRGQSSNALKMLLGDSRKSFAVFLYRKADIALHSGFYPTIFDRADAPKTTGMATEQHGHDEAHEKEMEFLGKPRDWIEAFGRNFKITEHTHLEHGKEREILPYLKVAVELDPQRLETYTVAAFFLRTKLGKIDEAEEFLREGLRNNPNSYELLLELGNLYHVDRHDDQRARNVWELALSRWMMQNRGRDGKDQDMYALEQIAYRMADLEEKAGNLEEAVKLLKLAERASPHPAAIQKQIGEINQRIANKPK